MDHASAADLLERYKRAWETFDGDAWTDLFTEDAEYHRDPFEPPMVGSNALRAYLLKMAESQDQVEMTVERHWVGRRHGPRRVARQLRAGADSRAGPCSPGS